VIIQAQLTTLAALIPLWVMPPPVRVAVLPIELNDVSNQPVAPDLRERLGLLTDALSSRLSTACGYAIVRPEPSRAPAETTPGYFYANPDVAVTHAGSAAADWVIIPRLNRVSPWVADLQAHVVRVRDTALVSNRVVEIKGLELTPELAARLVDRGAAWMADQISQSIEHASGARTAAQRRCRA
jgi:Protein of unknown function (DUF2380)